MASLYDIARMTSTTAGTGTVTLGSAVPGYITFANAGVAGNAIVGYGIINGAQREVGRGVYTSSNTALTRNVLYSTNGNALVTLTAGSEVYLTPLAEDIGANSPMPGYIFGLTMSTVGSTTSFTVTAGSATASNTANEVMNLAASISKTTGTWAVGSGNGSLDTGTISSSTWYHVFLIKRVDTSVVDVLTSLSASAPTLPSNYTWSRRIGSVKTSSTAAQWVKFVQDGDLFMWDVPVNDVTATNPGTAAVTRTLTVPTGVRVQAQLSVGAIVTSANTDSPIGIYISDLSVADTTPNLFTAMSVEFYFPALTQQVALGSQVVCMTNTSAQIRSRLQASAANTQLAINTNGWRDRRGQDS